MNSVGILIAELLKNIVDALVVLDADKLANGPLKSTLRGQHRGSTRTGKGENAYAQARSEAHETYSRAPTFRLSYSLSLRERWMLASMMTTLGHCPRHLSTKGAPASYSFCSRMPRGRMSPNPELAVARKEQYFHL